MIDLKEAIERAKQFIIEMYGDLEQFQVEEAILSEDKKKWMVTISAYKKIDSPNELQKTLGLKDQRSNKKVIIDNETEEIVGLLDINFNRREAA